MKGSANKYLKALCEQVGELDTLRAVAKRVDSYRKPGEQLESVAKSLGVKAILAEKLPFEGGIFSEDGNLIIRINSLSHPLRQRFTLAHELGHLMIAPGGGRGARRCLKATALEDACDMIAGELLMPLDAMPNPLPREASIDTLLFAARKFGASIQAAGFRCKEVGRWKESIGFWRWDGAARRLWFIGKSFWHGSQPAFSIFERAMRENSTVKATEYYSDLSGVHPVHLQMRRMGSDFLLGIMRA